MTGLSLVEGLIFTNDSTGQECAHVDIHALLTSQYEACDIPVTASLSADGSIHVVLTPSTTTQQLAILFSEALPPTCTSTVNPLVSTLCICVRISSFI